MARGNAACLPVDLRAGRPRGGILLSAVHLAAPCAGLCAALLDELLEVLDRVLHARAEYADRIARLLDDAFGLIFHGEADARAVVRHRLEAHRAGVGRAVGAAPRDHLVGHLLGDFGIPLLVLAPD